MPAHPRTSPRDRAAAEPSRLLPLSIAGLDCFLTALVLGYGGWYFFGTHRREVPSDRASVVQTPSAPTPVETPQTLPQPPQKPAPAGERPVPGGEVALGGEGTGEPLRREFVTPFAIAETEVTNEQYRDFVQATGHKAPAGWREGEFPPGAGKEPVTGVTWQDAVDYCQWLSEKIGATVRLPTEAEWELAARGKENYKYPWGNEWNARATVSKETHGRVRPVKSYEEGKSPYGAYDMAGNVWEWVADEARDQEGRPKAVNGVPLKVIKGGSAEEPRAFISATSRYAAAADKSSRTLGFRYVVLRDNRPQQSPGP